MTSYDELSFDLVYDLHVHSSLPDRPGHATAKPLEIIEEIKEHFFLDGFALTNHDTIEELKKTKKQAKKNNVDFIPGIEMSFRFDIDRISFDGEVLGYYIDESYEKFNEISERTLEAKGERNKELAKRLGIPKEALFVWKDKYDFRYFDKGELFKYCVIFPNNCDVKFNSKDEGYSKVENINSDLHINRDKTSLEEAVSTIIGSGGVPILAHGGKILRQHFKKKKDKKYFKEKIVPAMVEMGIKGFEIYPYAMVNRDFTEDQSYDYNNLFMGINEENDLINNVSGSDAHSLSRLGQCTSELETIERLKEATKYKDL